MGNAFSLDTTRLETTISQLQIDKRKLEIANRSMLENQKKRQDEYEVSKEAYTRQVNQQFIAEKEAYVKQIGQRIRHHEETNGLLKKKVKQLSKELETVQEMKKALSQIDGIVDQFGHA